MNDTRPSRPRSKRSKLRIGCSLLGGILFLSLVSAGYFGYQAGTIGAALHAKTLCSGIFLGGLDEERILKEDLDLGPLAFFRPQVNRTDKTVTSTALGGIIRRTAVYREGLGATLAIGCSVKDLRKQQPSPLPTPPEGQAELFWPTGDAVSIQMVATGGDFSALDSVLSEAVSEPEDKPRRTRALVVVYKGLLVGERYAPGITPETPLIGWSMTKSVTSALVGILVKEGKVSVEEAAPVPEWQKPSDPRGGITLDHLLRMSSGLAYQEVYSNPLSDVCVTLFGSRDAAGYVANRPLEADPGTHWHYATGTSVLISRIIRDAVGGDLYDYWSFPRRALFDKIGMRTAVLEPDPSGTFLGGSFMYACARDWARFGMLYLQDGVWEGERILPEGWVDYSRTVSPHSRKYGAHFWLNEIGEDGRIATEYRAAGFQGQCVVICPEKEAVIVRLGMTPQGGDWDRRKFVSEVLDALP